MIAYHLRQSFVPGEITPEEANHLGCELAKRFTKGNHAYIVCTHIDKAHIHNHVIWNFTALIQTRRFRNFWGSSRAVRRLNDTICIENGYSIMENPKRHGKNYNKWLGDKKEALPPGADLRGQGRWLCALGNGVQSETNGTDGGLSARSRAFRLRRSFGESGGSVRLLQRAFRKDQGSETS